MWNTLQSWRQRFSATSGRKILIKTVAQAIPTYCMGVFQIPPTLTKEMEKMFNSFSWGSNRAGGGGLRRM
ncbi:hypothetical protein LINGRAHAP2_LOCUS18006 [Linum grandiflorum]